MAHFLLRLNAPRPTFPADITAAEGVAMGAHSAYWTAKAEAGQALAVGPVMDPEGAWGMALVDCADAGQARQLADGDPVIQAGLGFSYDVLIIPSIILRRA